MNTVKALIEVEISRLEILVSTPDGLTLEQHLKNVGKLEAYEHALELLSEHF